MPNEARPVCECAQVPQKSCIGMNIPSKSMATPKNSRGSKTERAPKKLSEDSVRIPKPRPPETGSSTSVAEQRRPGKNGSKQEKRLNASRRTRSADRTDSHYTSHYTYIDSGSSILGGNIREDTITEAIYTTIQDSPNRNVNGTTGSQVNGHSRSQPVHAIPSMTSPPPTYDVAMWQFSMLQSGLPPSYEEYLCHKYAAISRSHTPPPPWSDSTSNIHQVRRDLLASQPELREYLNQLALAHNVDQGAHHQQLLRDSTSSNQQPPRKQQPARIQRTRPMPPRSQSESRAQQQRIATMYEDGAFCMETTAIQSAFDNGVAFCSVM
ncbi:uncharacterized protein LOC105698826 [Orussus abietinus]|uniref:uncharacterized protein LOC105698826 n=1 Tax=Orussus abietinus TaxID=222816 RepID=UPI0006268F13|nr:uncharacterized protein LOC105698826 [Orussus abietinus]